MTMIPIWAPQGANEDTIAYGNRALVYLLHNGDSPYLLPTGALETAGYVAAIVVRSRDMDDAARERLQRLRADIARTIARRRADADNDAALASLRAPVAPTQASGGTKVLRPKGPAPILPSAPVARFPETTDAF